MKTCWIYMWADDYYIHTAVQSLYNTKNRDESQATNILLDLNLFHETIASCKLSQPFKNSPYHFPMKICHKTSFSKYFSMQMFWNAKYSQYITLCGWTFTLNSNWMIFMYSMEHLQINQTSFSPIWMVNDALFFASTFNLSYFCTDDIEYYI